MELDKITIEKIHEVSLDMGMVIFRDPYSVTFGGIRALDPYNNTFNDKLFGSFYDNDGTLHHLILPGTVDAGLTSRLDPTNPNGVAIIQHSKQYKGVYQYQDPEENSKFRGHKGKVAFRQVGNMDYWRDKDKDGKLDFKGKTYTGNFLTNGHMMGTLGNKVNDWSEGCWGSTEKNMYKMFAMALIQRNHGLGDRFSYIMLHQKDF